MFRCNLRCTSYANLKINFYRLKSMATTVHILSTIPELRKRLSHFGNSVKLSFKINAQNRSSNGKFVPQFRKAFCPITTISCAYHRAHHKLLICIQSFTISQRLVQVSSPVYIVQLDTWTGLSDHVLIW